MNLICGLMALSNYKLPNIKVKFVLKSMKTFVFNQMQTLWIISSDELPDPSRIPRVWNKSGEVLRKGTNVKLIERNNWTSLAICRLHAELQAQVLLWVHHPVVAGGREVKHQPAPVGRLDLPGVEQERLRISDGERKQWHKRPHWDEPQLKCKQQLPLHNRNIQHVLWLVRSEWLQYFVSVGLLVFEIIAPVWGCQSNRWWSDCGHFTAVL